MKSDRERAIDVLQTLANYSQSERRTATAQAEHAKEIKDFRAMDRHLSYAVAMQKMANKISYLARNEFMHDTSSGQ